MKLDPTTTLANHFDPASPKQGIEIGLPMSEYQLSPGFSSHTLRSADPEFKQGKVRGHPLRMVAKINNDQRAARGEPPLPGFKAPDEDQTAVQAFGSLYHTMLFEPDLIASQYAILTPEIQEQLLAVARERKAAGVTAYSGRIKEAQDFKAKHGRLPETDDEKAACLSAAKARAMDEASWHPRLTELAEWQAAQREAGRTIVSPDTYALAAAMVDAIHSNPANRDVRRYVDQFVPGSFARRAEVSLYAIVRWQDTETEVQLRSRPDLIGMGDEFCDPKTALSCHPDDFAKNVSNFGYDIQAGVNVWASRLLADDPMAAEFTFPKKRFCFLAQEKEPPFFARLWYLPDEWLAYGVHRAKSIMRHLTRCWDEGDWTRASGDDYQFGTDADEPGELLEPPAWLIPQIEAVFNHTPHA